MHFTFQASLLSTAMTVAFAASSGEHFPVVQDIHLFPDGMSAENLAVRQNGQILTTFTTTSDLFLVDPIVESPATVVHSFSEYHNLAGILEVEPDQFYIVASNATPVLNSVFHLDMSRFPVSVDVTKVADFPEAQLLNGLGLLSKEEGLVYVADSGAGVIILLNIHNGAHHVAINNTLTRPTVVGGVPPTNIGVNGIHVFPASAESTKFLYFSSSAQGLLARIPIHNNGFPAGQPEVLASNLSADDFTLDNEGNVFLANHVGNEVVRIDLKTRDVTVLAGSADSTEIEGATAVQLGRLESDKDSIYVTLAGGSGVGGAVKRIDLGNLVQ